MNRYTLTVSTEADPDEWDENVIRLDGNGLHSYIWSRYSGENNSATPMYFWLKDSSGIVVAVSFGLYTEKRTGIRLYSALSFGSLAAASSPEHIRRMVVEIYGHCRKNGIALLSMNSFGTPDESDIIKEIGFKFTRRWEFILDIGIAESELWDKIHSKKRNLIRKGQKSGVDVTRADGLDHLFQFRQLALDTFNRKTKQGIPYPEPGPEVIYRRTHALLVENGRGRLYLAHKEGQVIAGAFFVNFNHKVYYMLSSSNDMGLKFSAPDLLLWTAMTDYQKEGYLLFNFGGLSESELNGLPLEESGLYHFKQRFSPQIAPCFKGSLILRPFNYRMFGYLKKLKSMVA